MLIPRFFHQYVLCQPGAVANLSGVQEKAYQMDFTDNFVVINYNIYWERNMKEKIKKYIVDTFMYGEGSFEDDAQLFESGIVDSMGFIKLLSFIEATFNVPIDMSEVTMDNFGTVNDIITMVTSKLENA